MYLYWLGCKVCWFAISTEQLAEIRKVTLAKVICVNSDYISKIQPNVMQLPFRQVYPSSLYVSHVTVTRAVFAHVAFYYAVCEWRGFNVLMHTFLLLQYFWLILMTLLRISSLLAVTRSTLFIYSPSLQWMSDMV